MSIKKKKKRTWMIRTEESQNMLYIKYEMEESDFIIYLT